MATRKTWIWIIVVTLSVCVVGMLAVAGASVYFVTSHIDTRPASSSEAFQEFDRARAAFREQKPLFELDQRERPRLTRELSSLPSATARPDYLWILFYSADSDSRIVKVNLPFWLLRLGRNKIKITHGRDFDLDRLNIDLNELQRIGPMLLLDQRFTSGERVLVWTK